MGKKHKAVSGEIIVARGPWNDVLLVCRKCSKKLDGGFGPDGEDSLPHAFRQVLRDSGRRRSVRVLEVGCLGVCPKQAVTVMHGAAPGEMLVVPKGLSLDALADRLPAGPPPALLPDPAG